ncbi:MAG: hypothetical protein KF819_21205 [Labilithrix sp.]|nr:hypothetical protein [Labilithrix sp.]
MPGNGARLGALAFELPRAITPTIAGLSVGAFVGVVGFIAVMLIVGRGRKPARRPTVMAIPRYATFPRDTPLPPQAFPTPRASLPLPQASRGPMPFVPSSELSARAFAKMGYAVDAPDVDPQVSVVLDELDEGDLVDASTPAPPAPSRYGAEPILPSVSVAPVVVLSAPPREEKSEPHPLGIIKSTSSAMRAAQADAPARGASVADLAFDDGPTEIGETFFDEPCLRDLRELPRVQAKRPSSAPPPAGHRSPKRPSDPPKIRAIAPAPPRFPAGTPPLPRVTPPPTKAVVAPRS